MVAKFLDTGAWIDDFIEVWSWAGDINLSVTVQAIASSYDAVLLVILSVSVDGLTNLVSLVQVITSALEAFLAVIQAWNVVGTTTTVAPVPPISTQVSTSVWFPISTLPLTVVVASGTGVDSPRVTHQLPL